MSERREFSGASQSVEDFLKAVYNLQREPERVSTTALALALGISAPAVTDMAQRLVDEGTVDYLRYRGVRLTEAGERVALRMLRRHRLIETYLMQDLGYALHEVHDEAEALEHSVSDRFVEAISVKLGHPLYDPHGDPIPDLDGALPTRDLQPLTDLALNTPACVRRLMMDDPLMLQASQARGLALGTAVEVVSREPFAGTLDLRLDAKRAETIAHSMAAYILVEVSDAAC